jgi:tRNA-2-methylthio-N6-dimethylallyladenosine synthase
MGKKAYIETYGCQMNIADSEVVVAILNESDYILTTKIEDADLILINTCSIRENAEQRIWGRLEYFGIIRRKRVGVIVGIIGCMAERLKEQLLETAQMVDLVVGPDAYRDLPSLIAEAESGHKGVNVLLSREETYSDISPVRMDKNGVTSFVSIMRGCNNMCAYCVVPYTRGAERSRDHESILKEIAHLSDAGYREVTLLGQNVDSYKSESKGTIKSFSSLLEMVAKNNPMMRIRFSTSHPKDMSDDVLNMMAKYNNICKHIHLPAQSGSNRILKLMNRDYTREWYMDRISAIRKILPGCSVSTDMIAGFCTETDDDHKESLSLMEWAGFDFAYMFKYSERPGTKAARKYKDDVPEETKAQRLNEIMVLQNKLSIISKKQDVGKTYEVLVEGVSKKSSQQYYGRTSQNKVVVFSKESCNRGDYVNVFVEKATSATLIGNILTIF